MWDSCILTATIGGLLSEAVIYRDYRSGLLSHIGLVQMIVLADAGGRSMTNTIIGEAEAFERRVGPLPHRAEHFRSPGWEVVRSC